MSRDMAKIFAAAEDAPAPGPAYRSCEVCARRLPSADVRTGVAKFRAEIVAPESIDPDTGKGRYPAGDVGYRPLTWCIDTLACRDTVEAFGESWPLDDKTPRPLRPSTPLTLPSVVESPPDKPAVEVAPDPAGTSAVSPAPPQPEQATLSEAPYADLDEGMWFGG